MVLIPILRRLRKEKVVLSKIIKYALFILLSVLLDTIIFNKNQNRREKSRGLGKTFFLAPSDKTLNTRNL